MTLRSSTSGTRPELEKGLPSSLVPIDVVVSNEGNGMNGNDIRGVQNFDLEWCGCSLNKEENVHCVTLIHQLPLSSINPNTIVGEETRFG